jgi:hypothetical protein
VGRGLPCALPAARAPDFLPPPSSLFTVAQALRSASFSGDAAPLIALRYMIGLPLLFTGVLGFVTAGHGMFLQGLDHVRNIPCQVEVPTVPEKHLDLMQTEPALLGSPESWRKKVPNA